MSKTTPIEKIEVPENLSKDLAASEFALGNVSKVVNQIIEWTHQFDAHNEGYEQICGVDVDDGSRYCANLKDHCPYHDTKEEKISDYPRGFYSKDNDGAIHIHDTKLCCADFGQKISTGLCQCKCHTKSTNEDETFKNGKIGELTGIIKGMPPTPFSEESLREEFEKFTKNPSAFFVPPFSPSVLDVITDFFLSKHREYKASLIKDITFLKTAFEGEHEFAKGGRKAMDGILTLLKD